MAHKPSAEFTRWAEGFNRRHLFGFPVVPPTTTGRRGNVPPTIVALPPRAGSMRFTDEDVSAVIDLLKQCEPGQAVRLTDSPDESDNTARRRAELLKEQIGERTDNGSPLVIKEGYKVRGHVLTAGEPSVKERTSEKSGKKYKVTQYPENWAAVSLVPENEPDEPAPGDPPAAKPAKPRSRS